MLPLAVLKIGTSSIADKSGQVDELVLSRIAQQIAAQKDKYRWVIVSSGAVGTGKKYIKNYSGKLNERKAAAAIGNPILLQKYASHFEPFGIPIAQSLCERSHFSNREQFLRLRDTFEQLWENGIIPIANENDVVSDLELKFSDNDELATLIAVGFEAEHLLLATSIGGVLDADNNMVPVIEEFDESVMSLARQDKSSQGLGGMISKLTFARLATKMGIRVTIFGLHSDSSIPDALEGKVGTTCLGSKAKPNARKKWLASGSLVRGKVIVDQGAYEALKARKSLLAVGVQYIDGEFLAGEVFEIVTETGHSCGVGLSKLSSKVLSDRLSERGLELAHVDSIVLW